MPDINLQPSAFYPSETLIPKYFPQYPGVYSVLRRFGHYGSPKAAATASTYKYGGLASQLYSAVPCMNVTTQCFIVF